MVECGEDMWYHNVCDEIRMHYIGHVQQRLEKGWENGHKDLGW